MPCLAKSNRPDIMAHIQVHLSAVFSNNAVYRWQELKSNQNPHIFLQHIQTQLCLCWNTDPNSLELSCTATNFSLNFTFLMFNGASFSLFSDIFFLCYFYTSNLFCFLFISLLIFLQASVLLCVNFLNEKASSRVLVLGLSTSEAITNFRFSAGKPKCKH